MIMRKEELDLDIIIQDVVEKMNGNIMKNIKNKFDKKTVELYCDFESFKDIAEKQFNLLKKINAYKAKVFKEEMKSVLELVVDEIISGKTLFVGNKNVYNQFILVSDASNFEKSAIMDNKYINIENLNHENLVDILSHKRWYWSHYFENEGMNFSDLIFKKMTKSVWKEEFNKYVENKKTLADVVIHGHRSNMFKIENIYQEKFYNENFNSIRKEIRDIENKEKNFLAAHRNLSSEKKMKDSFFQNIIEDRLPTISTIIIPFLPVMESYDLNEKIEKIEYKDYLESMDDNLCKISFSNAFDDIEKTFLQEKILNIINTQIDNKEMYPQIVSLLYMVEKEMEHKITNFEDSNAYRILDLAAEMFETFQRVINNKDLINYIFSGGENENRIEFKSFTDFINKGLLKYKNEYKRELVKFGADMKSIMINEEIFFEYSHNLSKVHMFKKIAAYFNDEVSHTQLEIDEEKGLVYVRFNIENKDIKYTEEQLMELSDLAVKTVILLGEATDSDEVLAKEGGKYREKYLSYQLNDLSRKNKEKYNVASTKLKKKI